MLEITSLRKRNTLAVAINGHLGNALFEIASAVAIAAHYNLSVCLHDHVNHYVVIASDVQSLLANVPEVCPEHIQKRMNMGDQVHIYNHCCVFEDFFVSPYHKGKKSFLFGRYGGRTDRTRMSLKDLFPRGQEEDGKIYSLYSFLQSWKYLQLAPKMAEVRLKPGVISNARKYLENIAPNQKRVALHLRVGDASGPNHIYNFPGKEYFHKAMQYFLEKWGSVKFLVFSDNPTWCKKQSLFASENIYILEGGEENAVQKEFGLMSACDGVILSVGTFGWWAGYFSSQDGGEVVYFKNNFNSVQVRAKGEKVVEEDHFPQNWIGLKAPALDRRGKLVQDIKGDVLPKAPEWGTLNESN